MLPLLAFRPESGGEPEMVRESQRRRGADVSVVDRIIKLDAVWRAAQLRADSCRKELAGAKRALSSLRKGTGHADATAPTPSPESLRELGCRVGEAEAAEGEAHHQLQEVLRTVGNLVHEHVPLAPDDTRAVRGEAFALRRLLAAGFAEKVDATATSRAGWRPTGVGLLAVHALLTHALGFVARRSFALLPTPLTPTADRAAKFGKFCRARGDGDMLADGRAVADSLGDHPLGALHATAWLQPSQLPLRYAYLRRRWPCARGRGSGGERGLQLVGWDGDVELCVCEVHTDDGSCWDGLEALAAEAEALHLELDMRPQLRDVSTVQLAPENARTLELLVPHAGPGLPPGKDEGGEVLAVGDEVEPAQAAPTKAAPTPVGDDSQISLGRISCQVDFLSRQFGVRCELKQMGERSKRHVHSVGGTLFDPVAALLALVASAPDDVTIAQALPETVRRSFD